MGLLVSSRSNVRDLQLAVPLRTGTRRDVDARSEGTAEEMLICTDAGPDWTVEGKFFQHYDRLAGDHAQLAQVA